MVVKRPGREADHSHVVPSLIMREVIPPLPQHVFTAWYLIKQWVRLHGVVFG